MTDWAEDERPTLELVKSMVTLPEVVELLGYEIEGGKIRPPWNPDERTPSCHIYEDHFYDYATGRHGDVVDFVQAIEPEWSVGKVVWRLYFKALRAGREPGDVEVTPVREVVDFTVQLLQYPFWVLYGHRWRHLSPPANCHAISDEALLIPHQDEDGVYGVKVRGLDGSKTSWPGSQFTKRLYHPDGYARLPAGVPAIITEGESDCWQVSQLVGDRATVFALPSGASSWKDHWLSDLRDYEKIIVIMDNDRAGKEARGKLERKIGWDRVKHVFVPQLFNDVREAVEAGWDGSALLREV